MELDGRSGWTSYAVMATLFSIDNEVRNQNGNAINFMVDVEFLSLSQMLDTLYRRLHTQRKDCSVKKMMTYCYSLMSLALKDKESVCVLRSWSLVDKRALGQ